LDVDSLYVTEDLYASAYQHVLLQGLVILGNIIIKAL
jgi:hypothetical protein